MDFWQAEFLEFQFVSLRIQRVDFPIFHFCVVNSFDWILLFVHVQGVPEWFHIQSVE